ncbi:MAG: radical SAM protein [Chloroflexota bacterium]
MASDTLKASVEDRPDSDFRRVLNRSLKIFFKDALRVSITRPAQAFFFFRTVRWQQRAARTRAAWAGQGTHVPPIMIFSITNRCNLHCKGCYHHARNVPAGTEMNGDKLRGIIGEARELGISFVVVAGGEPFLRPEMLDITGDYPEVIFLVFTNGLLIDEEMLKKLKEQKNVVPVISLEGDENETDGRRGEGVFARLQKLAGRLRKQGIFWSVSLTVTRSNFATITDDSFIKGLVNLGCKLFFFVEYTPVEPGTEDWLLTDEQRAGLIQRRDSFRSQYPALFIAVPGDEDEIGGCLSAGRGFIHISAEGNVEPCPFAPYSDINLRDSSLKDALQSPFLEAIRRNHGELRETEGGCALWVKREWVRSLLK